MCYPVQWAPNETKPPYAQYGLCLGKLVLLAQAAVTKYHVVKQQIYSHSSEGLGSPRSKGTQFQCLESFLDDCVLIDSCVLSVFKWRISLFLFIRTLIPLQGTCPLITQLTLITSPNGPPPNIHDTGDQGFNMWIFFRRVFMRGWVVHKYSVHSREVTDSLWGGYLPKWCARLKVVCLETFFYNCIFLSHLSY